MGSPIVQLPVGHPNRGPISLFYPLRTAWLIWWVGKFGLDGVEVPLVVSSFFTFPKSYVAIVD